MVEFVLLFILILFTSGIFINGWWNITRGRWEITPNGKKVWVGKIFNFWHKFFQQHIEVEEYYTGIQFYKKYFIIENEIKATNASKIVIQGESTLIYGLSEHDFYQLKAKIENIGIHVNASFYKENDFLSLKIYRLNKVYRLPELIRDPLAECITCFSSFYGVLSWIFWYQVGFEINKHYPTEMMSSFISTSFFFKVILMCFFCISLACVNELIYNANNKLKK